MSAATRASSPRPMRPGARRLALALLVICVLSAAVFHQRSAVVPDGPPYAGFHGPRRVAIRGYTGDAMEPFVTKDGKYLLFNNSNDPSVNTDLQYAARVNGLTFDYRGEISGVNTAALEGVPSMDRDGDLYFVSTRSYASTLSTLYKGRFRDGKVSQVALVPGVSPHRPGIVNFDAEISADGNTLYVVEGDFSKVPRPSAAEIVIAAREGDGFRRSAGGAAILRNVNTGGLNYAPAISSDGLELFFTRVPRITANAVPAIYRAVRRSPTAPFGAPQRVETITGFAEGPSLDADGRSLYYHKRERGRFVIYRVTR